MIDPEIPLTKFEFAQFLTIIFIGLSAWLYSLYWFFT